MQLHDTHPTVRALLMRPPVLSGGLIFGLVLLTFLGLAMAQNVVLSLMAGEGAGTVQGPLWAYLAFTLGLAAVIFRRFYVRSKGPCVIELHDGFVEMPASLESRHPRQVAYADIAAVVVRGSPVQRFLLVEAREQVFVFPSRAFVEEQGPERIAAALRTRIGEMSDGSDRLARMDQRMALGQLLMSISPSVTHALIGISAVMFANLAWLGDAGNPLGWISWGAAVPALFAKGELWRLLSSTFLHTDLGHAGFSLLGLFVVGGLLERLIGRSALLLTFFVASLAAAFTAVSTGVPIWLGSAGGVLGLLAAYGVLVMRARQTLPIGFRQPRRWWWMMLGLGALFLLTSPTRDFGQFADLWSYGSGAVAGASLGWIWWWRRPTQIAMMPRGTPVLWLSGLAAVLWVASLAAAVAYAADFTTDKSLEVAETIEGDIEASPALLNAVAWGWAIDEGASQPQLQWAARASEHVVQRAPEIAAFRDTMATVYARLARWDDAIREEIIALEQSRDPIMAWQLARFAAQRRDAMRTDPRAREQEALGDKWELSWLPANPEQNQPGRMKLTLPEASTQHLRAYAVVESRGRRVGLLQVTLAAGASGAYELVPKPQMFFENWPGETNIWIASVHPVAEAHEPVDWFVWPLQLH